MIHIVLYWNIYIYIYWLNLIGLIENNYLNLLYNILSIVNKRLNYFYGL